MAGGSPSVLVTLVGIAIFAWTGSGRRTLPPTVQLKTSDPAAGAAPGAPGSAAATSAASLAEAREAASTSGDEASAPPLLPASRSGTLAQVKAQQEAGLPARAWWGLASVALLAVLGCGAAAHFRAGAPSEEPEAQTDGTAGMEKQVTGASVASRVEQIPVRTCVSLVAGFGATLAIGAVYGWSVIGSHLPKYGYTKSEQTLIGTMSTMTVYFAFHAGFFFDRFGPRASLVLGFVCLVSGYLLTLWGIVYHHSAVLIGCYQIICSQGVQPTLLAAMENVKNFPESTRGLTTMVVFTGAGTTAILMSQLNKFFFHDDLPGFLAVLAIGSGSLVAFQFLVFVKPLPPPQEKSATGQEVARVSPGRHLKELFTSRNTNLFMLIIMVFGMDLFFWVVNIGRMSLEAGSSNSVNDLVAIFAVLNIITRPITGFLSDIVPFTLSQLLCVGMLQEAIAMLLLARGNMLLSSLFAGIADGWIFAIWVPLTKDVHGMSNYGLTFSIYLSMLGVGNIIINFGFDFLSHQSRAYVCVAVSLFAAVGTFFVRTLKDRGM